MRRVVVTGIGLLSSIGENANKTWENLIAGKSGINKIKTFDVEDLPCKIGGYISHDETDDFYLDRSIFLDSKQINRNDRFIQYGLAAARMAIEDSDITNANKTLPERIGVSVGSGIGGLETIYNGSITLD